MKLIWDIDGAFAYPIDKITCIKIEIGFNDCQVRAYIDDDNYINIYRNKNFEECRAWVNNLQEM